MQTRRPLGWTGIVAVVGVGVMACQRPVEGDRVSEPVADRQRGEFVGREVCAPCHPVEDRLWSGSHHDLAMQEAFRSTVLGDFDDATFSYGGFTSTFFRQDGGFYVRTDGPDGELRDYRIAYTFGAVPLQQYLIEFPGGRYQALSICWDTRPAAEGGQRWFHLYPEEAIDHQDPLHWTGPQQNWNYMCAECHSTDLRKNYRPDENRYETDWSEIDVACEACHGPGSEHVAWAKAAARDERPPAVEHLGLAVRLTDPGRDTWVIDPETGKGMRLAPPVETAEIETCARCHSRRAALSGDYEFGRPLAATHRLALLEEGLYHADGQILEEVYVHGSYLQSRMHQAGVTCSDCHEPHGLGLLFPGDDVCARCHPAATFDRREHHFHEPETAGAHCVDCHMPPKNYMVVDPRHDHSLRVPRPDLSLKLGAPNACNDCHRDRTASWSLNWVERWYGPETSEKSHYGEALHAGRSGAIDAERRLAATLDDPESPAIVRATAASLLGRYLSSASLPSLERGLRDEDPIVRLAALRGLEALAPAARLALAAPLLGDPVRLVRIEAARLLAPVPQDRLSSAQRSARAAALGEYREAQIFNGERPEAHANLGTLDASLGDFEAAEAAFRKALAIDVGYLPAYVNLADLYRLRQREDLGEQVLRGGLTVLPDAAALHHALGLLLVRRQRPVEALESLERAVTLAPGDSRYAYVYGVALHSAGETGRALSVLDAAHRRAPADRELLWALATISRDRGAVDEALAYARKLLRISPDDPRVEQLIAGFEQR